MQRFSCVLMCAALLVGGATAAEAQPPPRIKVRLITFDGKTLTLEPLTTTDKSPPADKRFTVMVLPDTQYVTTQQTNFNALKVGDYAGATASVGRGGRLRATEVHLYPDPLRGSGEGRLPASVVGQVVINGTLSAITLPGKSNGALTLHYRGAIVSGPKSVCEGRAAPPAFTSALSCKADGVIEVESDTLVTALVIGDAGLLTPGAVLTVSMAKNSDGKAVTPGVIVEKPTAVAKPVTVEKPQSPP